MLKINLKAQKDIEADFSLLKIKTIKIIKIIK